MRSNEHLDHPIARVATRQQGNITRRQLMELGLGRTAISQRVATGRLHRVHLGVYAVGRPPTTPIERASAALLACGPTATLSHASAMVLWGLWKRWPTTVEVSVTTRRGPKGIIVHHPINLAYRDVTTHQGIRTTSAARTLLDMATRLERKSLTRAVNNALGSPYLTEAELADVVARNPTHPATRRLKPLIADASFGLTRSELEDTFKHFGQTCNLPPFQTNVVVHGYVVDVYFDRERVIVELDSWQFHKDRRAFEADRTRDADALSHGIPTVRITHERMQQDPEAEAARLHAILDQRRRMLSQSASPQPGGARATRAVRRARRRAPDQPAR